ncbi:MAG: DUF2892 domain-containing protein [Gammaproteobacteria bacterium]|nr:MAG: DUF2892 domain-containing protein [Gammaproteobacteria bacterium]
MTVHLYPYILDYGGIKMKQNLEIYRSFIGNIGGLDALLRLVIGLMLILTVLLVDLDNTTMFLLAVLSVPTVFFAIMRWDPLYRLFNISTVSKRGDYTLNA